MLGKLIKYEFKHTAKTIAVTYAALAAATIMGSFALYQMNLRSAGQSTVSSLMCHVLFLLYLVAIIGIYSVDFIYLCYYYHKTMYSSQGYLTHTLPVSPAAIFGAKILVFFVWMLISTVLTALSGLILLQIGSGGEFLDDLRSLTWSSFSRDIYDLFGMSAGLLIFLFTLITILGVLMYILWITASMALGQLSRKNRAVCSILVAFGFYMVNKIANVLFLAASGYSTGSLLNGNLSAFMHVIIIGSVLMTAVFIAVLYGICIYVNKKRLNLE